MRDRGLDRLALVFVLLWGIGAALTPVIGIWLAIGGTALGLGLAALLLARRALLPLFRPTARLVAAGLAAGLLIVAVTYALYPLALNGPAFLTAGVPSLYVIFRAAEPLWVTRALLPFIILSEELVWRGVVLEALLRRRAPGETTRAEGSPPPALNPGPSTLSFVPVVLLGSLIYAAAHAAAGSPTLTVVALACGLFWSALRVLTGSLVPPLVCHLLWDFTVLALCPLA